MKWLSVVAAVVLVMHPGGGSTLDISPLASCTPDCTGVADGGKVPDPLNCNNYYYCMSGQPTDHPASCGDGSIFDPATSQCTPGTECTPTCGHRRPEAAPRSVRNKMHPGGGSTLDISPLASCEPDCSGVANFDMVPDPFNCTNYYVCMNGVPLNPAEACDDGEVFDTTINDCAADDGQCTVDCGPGGGGCQLSCIDTEDVIADVTDCNVFYKCEAAGLKPETCPSETPYFNGERCVSDESVCCTGYCEPYCDDKGTTYAIPDPVNCTSLYLCYEGTPAGPPDEENHKYCPSGMIFDLAWLECVPGDASTCVTLCDAATGGGGGGRSSTTPGSGGGSSSTPGPVTTTGGSSGCEEEPYTCPGEGRYPVCHYCFPLYYECTGYGAEGEVKECSGTLVFHPTDRFCMSEETCNETTP